MVTSFDESVILDGQDYITSKGEKMTRLQYVRKAVDMSQSELSKRSGIPLRTLQSFEIGARDIDKASVVTVLKLAQALGCKIEEIIEYGNEGWEEA